MSQEKEKAVARGVNQAVSPHFQSSAAQTEVLSATAPDTIEEFDRLFQAVEGYRVGALTRAGLMHYYEIARQFRIAHPEIVRAPDEARPQHPQRVITTDTVTGVQSERLLSAGNSSTPAPKEGRCHYCNRICADCFYERQINTDE